jgi:hypothetical protein
MSVDKEVPRLSPSIAKLLLDKSPLHAWNAHRLLGGQQPKPSASQALGSAVDALVFGGEVDCTKAVREKAEAIAKAIKNNFALDGKAQSRHQWKTSSSGYQAECSGVVDMEFDDRFIELKTGHDLSDHNIVKQIELYHYDLQMAAYSEATGKPGTMIFAETSAPYDVRPVTLTPRMLKEGRDKWHKAVRIWSQCMAENHWPGRGSLIADISSYRLKNEPGFVDLDEQNL